MKRCFALCLSIILSVLPIGCDRYAGCQSQIRNEPEQEIIAIETLPDETNDPTVESVTTAQQNDSPVPTDTPEPADTPEPTPTPPPYTAQDGIYTIAWMTDTQYLSKKFPDTYYTMTRFLSDHRDELNLKYIIHTGDLIHNVEETEQWEVADLAQSYIDDIPNGVLAGNHDCANEYWYSRFRAYFGSDRYQDKPWYGGSFEQNRGHYDLITEGDTEYIFVYMGYCPSEEAYNWVREAFSAYPERVGILCLHDYYTNEQTLSKDGQKWYDLVVSKTPNLYIVCCGHRYGAYCFPESFDDSGDGEPDRTVYQMLFNYQRTMHDGGAGYLRLIQINEEEGTMHVLTYSPLWDDFNRFDDPNMREQYYEFDESHEEFTLPLPWRITN